MNLSRVYAVNLVGARKYRMSRLWYFLYTGAMLLRSGSRLVNTSRAVDLEGFILGFLSELEG